MAAKYYVEQPNVKELEGKLFRQFKNAKQYREAELENEWALAEYTVFASYYDDGSDVGGGSMGPVDIYSALAQNAQNVPDSSMSIAYAFKYLRYLHSQASANPPACIPTPRTADIKDRRAARAADNFIHYARKEQDVQEVQDMRSLGALLHGTGYSKLWFNPYAGEFKFNKEEKTIEMSGDICSRARFVWDIYRDPDAKVWKDVKYIFDRYELPCEEALARWPEQRKEIEGRKGMFLSHGTQSGPTNIEYRKHLVEVFEYWERGLPWNGMAGRHGWLLIHDEQCVLLGDMETNEEPGSSLPYQPHTDIDVPGRVEGKSFLDYICRLQDLLNRVDSHILLNLEAHGTIKLVVWDDTDVGEQSSTDPYEIIRVKGTGTTPPTYVNPPQLMPDITRFRSSLIEGMEALAGMNELMFGQVKRELSGYTAQSSINSANLTRRRFFVKYKKCTEDFYRHYLRLCQEHYSTKKLLDVTGEEEAYSLEYFTGSDLEGGYDFSYDYGTSLSLDPESRQEQILSIEKQLTAAGVTPTQILRYLGMGDVKGAVDIAERAKLRQYEIFDKMEALYQKGVPSYIAPKKNEEHMLMLEACREYRSSALFQTFEDELQALIDRHIDERTVMAAQVAAGQGQPAAGGAPTQGALPALGAGLPAGDTAAPAMAEAAAGLAQPV